METDERGVAPAADVYAVELSGDPVEVPKVRHGVREFAVRSGFAERASDLALVLDELLANAMEHGSPPVLVRSWNDGRLVMTVTDSGDGFDFPSVVRGHPPVMLGKRGRGLWIVRQVADHVEVESGPVGTTVRVELTRDPHIGA
jgi:anti-sigma regulatory factor (Ser/Thr protein kinase)